MAVGAGGAFTGGVNRLPPVGLIDFSVGATVGGADVAGVEVVVVVVVDVAGGLFSSLAHEAVKPTIVTTAAPPTSAATRRAIRPMISSYLPDLCQLFEDRSGQRHSKPPFYQAHSDCAVGLQARVGMRRHGLPRRCRLFRRAHEVVAVYQQILDPVAHSLPWSSLVAALPLLSLFVMLGVLRVTAWVASLASLALAIVLAILVYGMPFGQTLLAGTEGAAFGFFPILWIVINAIWVYQMTVETGHFDVLRRSFARVSDDQRVQAVIIAFSFGALLEALAGFGTPVAVTSVMLIALGFKPLKAAVLALTANTAPVAFGAMATPIITLGKVTGLSSDTLGAMVGRQTPILALFVPLALLAIVDGWRGIRETWPVAVVCGLVFALAQYATSNFISVPLADVAASLLSAAAVVAMVRVWAPREAYTGAGAGAGGA